VAAKHQFLAAEFSNRWDRTYEGRTLAPQEGADEVVIALMKQKPAPAMRVKPVQPKKYYNEARISSGDRIIFRIEKGTVWFVDIVENDQRRPLRPGGQGAVQLTGHQTGALGTQERPAVIVTLPHLRCYSRPHPLAGVRHALLRCRRSG
jgi:hypothetical protein